MYGVEVISSDETFIAGLVAIALSVLKLEKTHTDNTVSH
jgi:hypothetical protein